MFGSFSWQEMMLVLLVILLLFGAKKLPELARGIGRSMGEFKKAREDFEREITRAEVEVKSEPKSKPTTESVAKESKEG